MPDAIITSTASTFGTISGVFSADQSTISGTISGVVPGTLTGSVGVPGPAGPAGAGVPAGGTAGQFLTKIDGTNYNTDWTTVNLSVYAVKSNNLSDLTSAPDARTNLGLGTMATATASDYSTTTVANGLYYPLSTNPAGYLTSASLTGYATESWVTAGFYPLTGNPSGFITSSALTPYLTSATAASTYQTLSGMSSYLTTSTAASTYATKASPTFTGLSVFNNPGNYAISIDNSAGYYTSISSGVYSIVNAAVEVIRLSGSGIKYPDGLTQEVAYPGSTGFLLKADNLSGLANTGTARTNLGLGTMAVETASNYLTTATAASTYFTIASAANKADLASPTFTGTPTLPTGTIATTQSPGNNTTAVATTAFVQQEVPAASTTAAGKVELATLAEIITGTDTARVIPVSQIPVTTASPYLRSLSAANATAISGSGAVTSNSGAIHGAREAYLASTAVGRASFSLGIPGTASAMPSWSTANFGQINFSNKIVMSGTTTFGISGYAGNASTCIYVTLGGYSTNTTGDMTQKGIGIKRVGGTGSAIQLIVHNGTSQTAVSTSSTPALAEAVNWTIYSDGAGNVTLYINGSQAATTSSGPTGANTAGHSAYREQVECPSGTGATHSIHSAGGWVYIRP